ncbi:hypothetical protein B0H14DRAFT_2581347 [Mycena olivaceomarginata]|nr:hypothetical protein B0H14DRAFT_2581347 [Mycena olivaceomarginata]
MWIDGDLSSEWAVQIGDFGPKLLKMANLQALGQRQSAGGRRNVLNSGVWQLGCEGVNGACREACGHEIRMCEELTAKWAGIQEKGCAYIVGEISPGMEVAVMLEDDKGTIDEEEGSLDYEDKVDEDMLD